MYKNLAHVVSREDEEERVLKCHDGVTGSVTPSLEVHGIFTLQDFNDI